MMNDSDELWNPEPLEQGNIPSYYQEAQRDALHHLRLMVEISDCQLRNGNASAALKAGSELSVSSALADVRRYHLYLDREGADWAETFGPNPSEKTVLKAFGFDPVKI